MPKVVVLDKKRPVRAVALDQHCSGNDAAVRQNHTVTLPFAMRTFLTTTIAVGRVLRRPEDRRREIDTSRDSCVAFAGRRAVERRQTTMHEAALGSSRSGRSRMVTRLRPGGTLHAVLASIAGCVLAACGGNTDTVSQATIPVTVVNQMPIPQPCMGASLTFFQGTTPVDIAYQAQKTIQVAQLFGAFQIGFQVNGWYWRTCTSPGNCPNTKSCQNPDNAGQVALEVAPDCSTATLIQNFSAFTCDSMVPNASQAVTVTLQSANPCTVVVAGTANTLTPTDACCSCTSCTGSQIPAGQVPHCQA